MDEQEIQKLVARQRRCFRSGSTLSYKNRMAALTRLERLVTEHENEIQDALRLDLGKSAAESYMCETGLLLNEIHYLKHHLRLWMQIGSSRRRWRSFARQVTRSLRPTA